MYYTVNKSLSEIKTTKIKPRSIKYKEITDTICNTSMSFDIETSNGFYKNGKVIPFDKRRSPSYWEKFEKVGICYIWQFAIEGNVFYGRYVEDFVDFIDELDYEHPEYKIIYVHNLGFEFNAILRENFDIKEVFAREERHPIYIKLTDYNIEFRCSYKLTNLSLDNCVKEYRLLTKKLVGNLDYLKIRTPKTKLTKEELEYCFNDVLIVNEIIDKYKKEYNGIYNIPLTQTGEVRRDVQKLFSKNIKWLKLCKALNNFNYEQYYNLSKYLLTGGSTHANRLYVNEVLKQPIFCYDFASSYPWVLISKRYPLSCFIETKYNEKYENDYKYSYIVKYKFVNLQCTTENEYLSESKAVSIKKPYSDNGKLISADECIYFLTNIDMKIVRQCYTWDNDKSEILNFQYAINDYLPNEFRRFIVNLYFDKTTLKNVDSMQDLYLKKKQKINACYGMMLTALYNIRVKYDNIKGWDSDKLCESLFYELKEKQDEKSLYSNYLVYHCGIWVTAFARFNLWQNLILPCDDLVQYYDTDSIYGSDKIIIDYVKKYNDTIPKQHKEIAKQLNIEVQMLSPKDVNGKKHPIGLLELDGEYIEGVYMGAKRYALRKKDGTLKQTVAGVRKGSVTALNDDLHNFNKSLIYDYDESQKNIMTYNECQTDGIIWNEGKYDEFVSHNQYSNNLMPTTYQMKISEDYLKLVDYFKKNKCKRSE